MGKGLNDYLAPLGNAIVDPGGRVSAELMAGTKETEEEKRRRLAAAASAAQAQPSQSVSAIEAAAAQPKERANSWNPFVWLFGQPGASSGGVLRK